LAPSPNNPFQSLHDDDDELHRQARRQHPLYSLVFHNLRLAASKAPPILSTARYFCLDFADWPLSRKLKGNKHSGVQRLADFGTWEDHAGVRRGEILCGLYPSPSVLIKQFPFPNRALAR
jgi:hypothetical protein